MVLSNEMVLIEQYYTNDRGPGWGVRGARPSWSWNRSSFWTFNGSRKFACFL